MNDEEKVELRDFTIILISSLIILHLCIQSLPSYILIWPAFLISFVGSTILIIRRKKEGGRTKMKERISFLAKTKVKKRVGYKATGRKLSFIAKLPSKRKEKGDGEE